jgi:hypothetical protein
MKIQKGDIITWECRAGTLYGKVADIVLDLNAANEVCGWMKMTEVIDLKGKKHSNFQMNATHGYLKIMTV